ncbi:MAG: 5'/3'-nucleotidase SurE [Anaerolineae bacterium]
MKQSHILLTNDDGIRSPGLWAAAEALSQIGYVTVAAPRDQSTGMGRSLPPTSDGIIREEKVQVNGQWWRVYAVGGTPAQAVLHGILEIATEKPDLVVSGINYGENVGLGITISGTVGAAMEAAALGYPALAVSLEVEQKYHRSYSNDIDFSAAAYFTAVFARLMLEKRFPPDVDLLKVDVPSSATPATKWQVTRLARQRYYEPVRPQRISFDQPATVGYKEAAILDPEDENSDVYVLRKKRLVSVTPISLDMTSRVDLNEFENFLRG